MAGTALAMALGASAARGRSTSAPVPGRTVAKDLSAKTREELYQLARRKGIAGRSAMTKRDLVRVLSR